MGWRGVRAVSQAEAELRSPWRAPQRKRYGEVLAVRVRVPLRGSRCKGQGSRIGKSKCWGFSLRALCFAQDDGMLKRVRYSAAWIAATMRSMASRSSVVAGKWLPTMMEKMTVRPEAQSR